MSIRKTVKQLSLTPALRPFRKSLSSVLYRERILSTNYKNQRFFYPSRSVIGQEIASGRGWDNNLTTILKALLSNIKSTVIFEVGSNIGASLLQMESALNHAQFYCFEPSDRFFEILRKNIESNNWANVISEKIAFASGEQDLYLNNNVDTASAAAQVYDNHTFLYAQKITTTTLDQYCKHHGVKNINLIKSDTDGYDMDVLLGGKVTITRDRPILYFEFEGRLLNKAGRSAQQFLNYIASLGYSKYIIFDNLGAVLYQGSNKNMIMKLHNTKPYLDILSAHKDGQLSDQKLKALAKSLTPAK